MSDFKTYLVSYRHDGGEWNIELPARSESDARARLGQLYLGRVDGEIAARIPAGFGPIASLIAAGKNLLNTTNR